MSERKSVIEVLAMSNELPIEKQILMWLVNVHITNWVMWLKGQWNTKLYIVYDKSGYSEMMVFLSLRVKRGWVTMTLE